MTDATIHRRDENCNCAIGTTCWDFWHTVGLLESIGYTRFEAMERAEREVRLGRHDTGSLPMTANPNPHDYTRCDLHEEVSE